MTNNSLVLKQEQIQVSVIIAAYNAADTITDTLQSLIAQTFIHWEAIVVDDGSNDGTSKVVSDLIKKDNRIRLVKQQNKGESGARNSGIELANFDWMLFLDSDDWILPQHLERLTDLINKQPHLDAVYCGWTYVTPDGKFIFPSSGSESGDLFSQHAGYCFSVVHTYLMRSSLVKETGGFDLSLYTCADWDMWQRIARTGARFGVVPEVLAVYRIRAGSATRNGYQLFKDGLQVIKQGHSFDMRVLNPHPLHTNGNSTEELSMRKFELACACAGYLIGGGKDARPLLDLIKDDYCSQLDAYSIASCLFRHTMISSSQPLSSWRNIWPDFAEHIDNFLIALEKLSGTPKLFHRTHRIIRYLAIEYSNDNRFIGKFRSFQSRLALAIYSSPSPIHRMKKIGRILLNH